MTILKMHKIERTALRQVKIGHCSIQNRGLQVSGGDVLEHLFLKRQIGNKTLQAYILSL